HKSPVLSLASTSDQKKLISGSFDGSIRIFDTATWNQITILHHENRDGVAALALFQDDRLLASISNDDIRLWDLDTNFPVGPPTQDGDSVVISLCWSTDGEHVLTGYLEGMIRVWNIRSGNTILGPIKTGHKKLCVATYFHDKTKIATGGKDENAIKIWDAMTGKLLSTVKHDSAVGSLASTSDQKKLISGSFDGSIRIFDTATWKQVRVAILKGHTELVRSIALFQNDRLLASVSIDNIRLWDLDTNFPVGPPIQREHVDAAAISTDGKLLIAFSWNT
ncbi:WD40 repeat-like protein, partial [Rhizopogon vinicolor AM-OR11-026]